VRRLLNRLHRVHTLRCSGALLFLPRWVLWDIPLLFTQVLHSRNTSGARSSPSQLFFFAPLFSPFFFCFFFGALDMSFQPVCGLCLSDCDRRGSVTSCSHFLCSRCLSRLPTAAPCPLCQRPCRMMTLDQAEVQPLLQSGTTALDQAARVVSTQLRHYQQINRRMRQALELLHRQYQTLRRQREEALAGHIDETRKVRALEAECHRLRDRLTRTAAPSHPSRSPSVTSSSPRSHGHRHGPHRTHPHREDGFLLPLHPQQQQHANAATPSLSPNPTQAARGTGEGAGGRRGSHGSTQLDAAAHDAAQHSVVPPAASAGATPPTPLGWSSSSIIAKRTRGEAAGTTTALLPSSSFDRNTPAGVELRGGSVCCTPRSQAIASLQPALPYPGGLRRPEESTVPPTNAFRLHTPLAAALQRRHALPSPSQESHTTAVARITPPFKPLQKLFTLRGAAL
jgi:hypothetical protein